MQRLMNVLDVVFVKWLIVGISCFYIDYTIFLFLFTQTPFDKFVTLCNGLSMGSATIANYLLHKFWTFKSQKSRTSSLFPYLVNFFSVWIIGTLFLKLMLVAGVKPGLAKLSAAFITLPISYVALRFYVFSIKKASK